MGDAAGLPLCGSVFEETIDGYFPLSESLRQVLVRQGFGTALVSILHAPMMEVPGLGATEPVPLYLRDAFGGMIDRLTAVVQLAGGGVRVSGQAIWRWEDGHRAADRTISSAHRLSEPALLRGIGIVAGPQATQGLGGVAPAPHPTGITLWSRARAPLPPSGWQWHLPADTDVITRGEPARAANRVWLGDPEGAESLTVDASSTVAAELLDAIALGR